MRLPDVQPTDARNAWALTIAEEETELLGITMKLGFFAPPGILERLMASCYGLGKYHKFWKRGALIETELHSLLIELRVRGAHTPNAHRQPARTPRPDKARPDKAT